MEGSLEIGAADLFGAVSARGVECAGPTEEARIRHRTEPIVVTGHVERGRHAARRRRSFGDRVGGSRAVALNLGLSAVVALTAVFIGPAPAVGQTRLALVVHAENPIEDISLDDLRRLFEGRLTTLPGMSSVSLYQHTPSRGQFYEEVLNTTVSRATRAWMALVFSGEVSKPPVDIEQADDLIEAVASRRSALGFVPLSAVDTSRVRVIRVNGTSIRDAGYVLR